MRSIVKNKLIPAFVDSESSDKFIINVNKIEEMITVTFSLIAGSN